MLVLTVNKSGRIIIGTGYDEVSMFIIGEKVDPMGRVQYDVGFESPNHIPIDRETVRLAKHNRIDNIMSKSNE